MSGPRIRVGTIATAHGVRGLVKLILNTEDPNLLDGPVHTGETGDKTLTFSLKNPMGKYWLAEVGGISDRTMAETLRGTALWIPRDRLPQTAENEYYLADLTGLSVRDPAGKTIGAIIDFADFGAGNLLEIRPAKGGETFYLPFTGDNVPEVNVADGYIVADLPEGLYEP